MVHLQVSLTRQEHAVVKAQAKTLGISVTEVVSRAIRDANFSAIETPWMKFAGFVETSSSGRTIDDVVYFQKD